MSGQPTGLFTQLEEIDIDFRIPGLSHAVVKQAENFRVQELVKKIESHLHREALQADLQENNVYNPFCDDSKAMIRELGNVELFELCETIPEVQCSECPLCWNQGVIYCTCGHLLVESESSQNFNKWRQSHFSVKCYSVGFAFVSWWSVLTAQTAQHVERPTLLSVVSRGEAGSRSTLRRPTPLTTSLSSGTSS